MMIHEYAKIVDPLCRLTEGEWPTRWDSESVPEECRTALEKLKTALTSPAVLSKPDPKLAFELHVDASDTGIAGKLNQIEPSSDVQDESNVIPTPKERLIAPAGMCPELIFPYIPYLSAYPSGSSPALSRRRKNTGVNLK